MPIRDCMSSSPFCPVNKHEEFAVPGLDSKGCDACVEEGLKHNEIPKCFFCKVEGDESVGVIDYSVEAFAKKVTKWTKKHT